MFKLVKVTCISLGILAIAACSKQPAAPQAAASQAPAAATQADPYQWLAPNRSPKALQWVAEQNAITGKAYMSSPAFEQMRTSILQVLESKARIPYVRRMGPYLYNFWQGADHPRGIWRRTTLAEYEKPAPKWETLLDLDALDKAEGKSWVFKGAQCLRPKFDLCLVSLSPGGGDAVEVREFDVASKSFLKDGFEVPVAKTSVGWIDQNHIYIGTDFGPGSLTNSGYPRIVKEWTRGTPLSSAVTVFTGVTTDVSVDAEHDSTPGFERDFVREATDFFHQKMFLRKDGKLTPIDVPSDADMGVHRQWMLVGTKSAWTIGGKTWPAGALLAIHFDQFMAGQRDFTPLFVPDAHTVLSGYTWTRHHVIVTTLHDVKTELEVLTPPAGASGNWMHQALPGTPQFDTVRVVDTDPQTSDEYWLAVSGFLDPPALERGVLGAGPAKVVKQEPAQFNASKFVVSQHFATSEDGTRIPYFEVAPKAMKLDGQNPTLETGYGGFDISSLPGYSAVLGRAWLAKGGVFVLANIRGGGEYGPAWHKAAMRANRPKAYQDFAAVAQDLIKRGVTSSAHLGAHGASNGGLLMGNMLVDYPQLYGAIACEVPLLNMKDFTHLSAGASWIAEYGNPANPKDWAYMKTFSPYQNVKTRVAYPPVLFYTTTTDDRVGPAQARMMAAKMEAMGYKDVWFYENTQGGHGAGAEPGQVATTQALQYSFLWNHVGP